VNRLVFSNNLKWLRSKNIFSGVIAVFVFLSLTSLPMVFAETNSIAEYRTDQILIQPKAGINRTKLTAFHAAHGGKMKRTFNRMGGMQVITLPAGETVPGFLARYRQSGLVEFAEPDYLGHIYSTIPNDPKYLDGTLWGLNAIDAPEGWDVLTSASNIVVVVIDTGVRYTHEDLAANMWINPNDGSHGLNVLTGTSDPSDDSGHGTGVAGVLGAVGNNGKGVTGVAWQVQIMACKCFNNLGVGSVSAVVTGLEYAQTNGARIINASWGFPDSLALSNAIYSLRDSNIIVVAACGNSATDIDLSPIYPASYHFDNIVTVAYTTRTDTLASASNYGATSVHLAAPGDQIFSTFGALDNFYLAQSGTSFAAPYVSGALALMLAKYPTESYQQIIQRLLNATDPLPSLAGKCVTGGRLNLKKALNPSIWLSSVMVADTGMFQLHLSTGANRQCAIQTSPDLINWTPIYTNTTSTNGTFDFTNTIASPQQFFRATTTP
jgi:subtilisin family serine protease